MHKDTTQIQKQLNMGLRNLCILNLLSYLAKTKKRTTYFLFQISINLQYFFSFCVQAKTFNFKSVALEGQPFFQSTYYNKNAGIQNVTYSLAFFTTIFK